MPIKYVPTLFVAIFTSIVMVSCHHNPASQAPASPVKQNTSYTGEAVDTSNVVIDKNAKDGLNIIKYKNGVTRAKGYYRSGKKYGEWQSFYQDGKLWSDEYFTLGVTDGKITVWYDNDEKMYEGEYRSGKPVGTWSYWDDKGRLLRTSDYNKKSPNTAL